MSTQSLWQALKNGPLKVLVIGGGNWGSVIGRIASQNAGSSYVFNSTVHMWLREEDFNGRPLTQVINETHENPKYLPGHKLPENLVAVSELLPYAAEADLIVVVLPHQFVESVCNQLRGHIKPTAKAVSLGKGLRVTDGRPELFSSLVSRTLNIPCSVLSGANVANDIAREHFSESTLGYKPSEAEAAAVWQQLFDTPYFKVTGVPDICGVEVCGAVKNVVALAAGFCDGLKYGTNTKAAIIRLGVEEMKLFANLFFNGILEETFFDSAGYADVVTTCFGGRNVRCAAEFVLRGGQASWATIEAEMLNGQKLQGNLTCQEIHEVIEKFQLHDFFPLFTTTYNVAFNGVPATEIIGKFSTHDTRKLKLTTDCNACLVPQYLQNKKSALHKDLSA